MTLTERIFALPDVFHCAITNESVWAMLHNRRELVVERRDRSDDEVVSDVEWLVKFLNWKMKQ